MIKINKQRLKKVSEKFNIDLIVLFGSTLNNSKRKDSDIDLGIKLNLTNNKKLKFNLEFALISALIKIFKEANLDIVILNDADALLLFEVAQDGLPIYEKRIGEFLDFQLYAMKRYNETKKFRKLEEEYIRVWEKS